MSEITHAASRKVVAQGSGTLLGQDLSAHGNVEQAGLGLGPVFPKSSQAGGAVGEGSAQSIVGRDLQDMVKSVHGENARIISDVIQPASFPPATPAGYVRISQQSIVPMVDHGALCRTNLVPAQYSCPILRTESPLSSGA